MMPRWQKSQKERVCNMNNTLFKFFSSRSQEIVERETNSYARKNNLEIMSVSIDHDKGYYIAGVVFKKIQPVDC